MRSYLICAPFSFVLSVALSLVLHGQPSLAKESTKEPATPRAAKTTKPATADPWMAQCTSNARLSLENAIPFCQCVLDKVGQSKAHSLKEIEKKKPEIIDACTTVGPKVWIPRCIRDSAKDSGMDQKRARKYCQCIWDRIGPENVPDLASLKEMDPQTLAACK